MSHVFWQHPIVPEIRAQLYVGDRLTGTGTPSAPSNPAATLWVDSSIGDDDLTRAQVRSGGGALAWATIERAVWGSNDRQNMLPGEAAEADDVVAIVGSADYNNPRLYTTNTAMVEGHASPVYLPANSGSSGHYITFQASGYVKLGAPAANAPVIGTTDNIDYIKWYADRADSRFIIVCDGRFSPAINISGSSASGGVLTITTSSPHGMSTGAEVVILNHTTTPPIIDPAFLHVITVTGASTFTINNQTYTAGSGASGYVKYLDDVKADTSVVNTRPDTGPVFVDGTGIWIEGFDIDGGEMIDYGDNYNGIRLQSATSCTIRNNYIHDFRRKEPSEGSENTNHNQSAITSYGAAGCTIEHNVLENCGAGYYFKDLGTVYQPQQNNILRYNWISAAEVDAVPGLQPEGIVWSVTAANNGPNDIYQNVLVDLGFGFFIAAQAPADDVYNNTVARTDYGFNGPFGGHTMRVWNNIFSVEVAAIYQDSVNVPVDTATDFEHNCYVGFGATTFMQDASGNHSFAQWLAEYPSQDQAAPASINSDPLFTNAAADDFTLQGGSPARDLGRHPDTAATVHAGAYLTGTEEIGLES